MKLREIRLKRGYALRVLDGWSEPTVQQEEMPQPPPPRPDGGTDVEIPPPESDVEKGDSIFLTSPELHLGHFVSRSEECMLWINANFSEHFPHIYS
jgi:hypothetical protein